METEIVVTLKEEDASGSVVNVKAPKGMDTLKIIGLLYMASQTVTQNIAHMRAPESEAANDES